MELSGLSCDVLFCDVLINENFLGNFLKLKKPLTVVQGIYKEMAGALSCRLVPHVRFFVFVPHVQSFAVDSEGLVSCCRNEVILFLGCDCV